MATAESQAAMAKLAADTKTACATSADIAKAAAAKAKAAGKPPAAKGFCSCAKAAVAAHSFYALVAGGVVIGVAAYYLVNKFWLNKDKCC